QKRSERARNLITTNMKILVLAALATVAVAAPQGYGPPRTTVDSVESAEFIPILRDSRAHEEDGTYSFDVETANGIVLSQAGDSAGDKQGAISFTHPDGTEFHLTFVADENGYQPQSSALPVAPAFPHPTPDFVLEQIEFARQEDEAAAREAKSSVRNPSGSYGAPSRKKREAPAPSYSAPRSIVTDDSAEFIPILRDTRVHEEDGTYNFDIETANGIVLSQAGDSDGDKQGVVSFTHPDGTEFHLTFVADENGYQPQSSALPVAPAFPHPIPDFVLEQIEFARQEDEAAAREAKSSVRNPSGSYGAPSRKKRETPAPSYSAPRSIVADDSAEFIPILRDTRAHQEDGTYNFDVETANGIVLSQAGDSDGDKQGVVSFTHPDGTEFHLTFVADENGYQPQSSALPVAPAFPHPIPDFVLEQIEFARQEDEAAAREAKSSVRNPSGSYGAPSRKKREAPGPSYSAPRSIVTDDSAEFIPILRDTRVHEEDGTYNFDVETANGIVLSQSGDSDGHKQGVVSFTHPDGTEFHLTFVADENGFQPQSSALPVAPAFPHPIPDFVLEQIEFARQEDEAAAREAKSSVRTPNSNYGAPNSSEEN
ncbi:unnamed protein product, partial [Meganyctiphanes norvegica]